MVHSILIPEPENINAGPKPTHYGWHAVEEAAHYILSNWRRALFCAVPRFMPHLVINTDHENIKTIDPLVNAVSALLKAAPIDSRVVMDGPHTPLFQDLWHTKFERPSAKMSIRLGPQDNAVGALLKTPPSESQPGSHLLQSQDLWYMILPPPSPKMYMRLGPRDTAATGVLKVPPRASNRRLAGFTRRSWTCDTIDYHLQDQRYPMVGFP